jgi:phage shock protein C
MKKIFKLRKGRIIDGVCGGAARYIGVETVWVRLGWAILSLAGGIGILAYILGMYMFPREDGQQEQRRVTGRSSGPLIAGIVLIAVGVLFVLRVLGILHYGFWGAWHVAWVILWPLSLFAGGAFLLFIYWRQGRGEERSLRRLKDDRMILGVCGGLGEYFRVDPNIMRFFFALIIILSRGVALIVYVVVGLLTPESRDEAETPGSMVD